MGQDLQFSCQRERDLESSCSREPGEDEVARPRITSRRSARPEALLLQGVKVYFQVYRRVNVDTYLEGVTANPPGKGGRLALANCSRRGSYE
jgi:hypothetical protein